MRTYSRLIINYSFSYFLGTSRWLCALVFIFLLGCQKEYATFIPTPTIQAVVDVGPEETGERLDQTSNEHVESLGRTKDHVPAYGARPEDNISLTRIEAEPIEIDREERPITGGSINLAIPQRASHLDVHLDASKVLSSWGPGLAYSRLMRSERDAVDGTASVRCDLCESWSMSDETTLDFKLREGVLWQNIYPVNARQLETEDIVYSLERQITISPIGSISLDSLSRLEVLGDRTLRINLKSANADIFFILSDGRNKIVAEEAVKVAGDLKRGPTIGTGPWVFQDNENAAGYRFVRNAKYFENHIPYLDNLNIHVIPSQNTRRAAFKVGRVDVHKLTHDEWGEFKGRSETFFLFKQDETSTGMEISLNTTQPPFDDIALRRAAFFAMNPQRSVSEIWDDMAYASTGMPLPWPDRHLEKELMHKVFYDLEASVNILRSINYPREIKVNAIVGDYGERYKTHAAKVASEMRLVGFDVELTIVNRKEFGDKTLLGGDYNVIIGPSAPIHPLNHYLFGVLHSDGLFNSTGLNDPILDSLIELQSTEYANYKRMEIVRDIQIRSIDLVHRFMPATEVSVWAWWDRINGFYPTFTNSEYFHWSKAWVEH